MTIGQFAEIIGGRLVEVDPDTVFRGFTTDSRESQAGKVFLAIRGEHVDGHEFALAAIAAGAVAAVVERSMLCPSVQVEHLVSALARYAAYFRNSFAGPVVGVTGSAGKTTTKEMIAACLSPLGPVLKTVGNRNSEYTSPLIWGEMDNHRAVVVEMGMRGFGQIAHLASFVQPTIGVVTNIGYAHIEKVGSREGIARAKSELLQALDPEAGISVVWQEDEYLQHLKYGSPNQVRTFGSGESADCRLLGYRPRTEAADCVVEGSLFGERFEATLPTFGRHNALNACAAILVAACAGVPVGEAVKAISKAAIPPMRMEIRRYRGGLILLDAYNASPPSVEYALEALSECDEINRRWAVLGEMRELGNATEEGHRRVGRAVAKVGLERVMLIGEATRHLEHEAIAHGMPESAFVRPEEPADIQRYLRGVTTGVGVLVKGSRALELERYVPEEELA